MSTTLDKRVYQDFLASGAGSINHLDGFRTLVLNADYSPFSVIPLSAINWRDAIVGVILDKYDIVKEYEGIAIRSPSVTIPLPSIVAAREYRNPDQTIPFSKNNIFLRDEYTCQYCGHEFAGSELTFDHVIPRSKGGGTDWYNIVSACDSCNRKKGNNEHWVSPIGKKGPLKKPYKPSYFDLAGKMKKRKLIIPEGSGWEDFIYWEGPLYLGNKAGRTYQLSGPDSDPIESEELGY
jgi:5-methylcytosine-specific restriction endonuclease McrA